MFFNRKKQLFIIMLLTPATGYASAGVHNDPIAPVILGVTGILFFAVIGRFVARKLNQPSVLGELIMGIAVGNIFYYFGLDFITLLREGTAIFDMLDLSLSGVPLHDAAIQVFGEDRADKILSALKVAQGSQMIQIVQTVDVFSRYGIIFLLFLVGLETSVAEMTRVGASSLRVAIIGVALPFLLGFSTARLLMPELSLNVDLFIAATLGATSIGITASVLSELKQTQTDEARTILGAAVIDDILGLLMLAIVSGIIVSGGIEFTNIVQIVAVSILFLVGSFSIGPVFLRYTVKLLCRLDIVEAKLFISFLFVMVLAWFANLAGLATIIGAFTAGLILSDAYFHQWQKDEQQKYAIKDLIAPLETILVPIFFILMGIQVKLESFMDIRVVLLASVLIVAAIIGKLFSGLGAKKEQDRLSIGIGMMPRGEVGLIFASIGKSLGVINDALFSAVVLMVIVTTLITPPALNWSLARGRKKS